MPSCWAALTALRRPCSSTQTPPCTRRACTQQQHQQGRVVMTRQMRQRTRSKCPMSLLQTQHSSTGASSSTRPCRRCLRAWRMLAGCSTRMAAHAVR
jgi:hypothetical protein